MIVGGGGGVSVVLSGGWKLLITSWELCNMNVAYWPSMGTINIHYQMNYNQP